MISYYHAQLLKAGAAYKKAGSCSCRNFYTLHIGDQALKVMKEDEKFNTWCGNKTDSRCPVKWELWEGGKLLDKRYENNSNMPSWESVQIWMKGFGCVV